jgi:DNA-binding response OmpR family regulator
MWRVCADPAPSTPASPRRYSRTGMADILVIDDDAQMRRLVARVLKASGHTVHEADNGRAGLELFFKIRPALVITDIVMPDGEGIEVITSLRRATSVLPILAISGSGRNLIYLRIARGLGATAGLEKPFHVDELRAAVENLLGPPAQSAIGLPGAEAARDMPRQPRAQR